MMRLTLPYSPSNSSYFDEILAVPEWKTINQIAALIKIYHILDSVGKSDISFANKLWTPRITCTDSGQPQHSYSFKDSLCLGQYFKQTRCQNIVIRLHKILHISG